MENNLPFEAPLLYIEDKIRILTEKNGDKKELKKLKGQLRKLEEKIYKNLTPWQIVQVARYNLRPKTLDYIKIIFDDFLELHGDRNFSDDPAIVGGLALFEKNTVMVIGHQKGKDVEENIKRRFGMPNPDGYRKAQRLMKLSEKMQVPIITFIDTSGAYPGIDSEERGQAEAISQSIITMLNVKVPTISIVIGEGGSGGALCLSCADKILMLKYSIFSVISPEGCAVILWRDENYKEVAAKVLKLTSQDLLKLKIIDEIIDEPIRGAHYNLNYVVKNLSNSIKNNLSILKNYTPDELLNIRKNKYLKIGKWRE